MIRKTTYNAEVETIHKTIQIEDIEVERIKYREDFLNKVTTNHLWYNYLRKNCYRNDKSPLENLKQIAPENDSRNLLLPVIELHSVMEKRLTLNSQGSLVGGHDVPWHALILPSSLNKITIESNDYFILKALQIF